jgi:DtxR family transcriptional regulator, Mn-dependent transcriptional regulator
MNRAEEDYIKAIYELTVEKKEALVKTNEISEHFGFTDQTVNEMIKKLEVKNLLIFYPYKGIELTDEGKEEAIRMIRSHRLWEVFLMNKLGFSWEEVHEDAERLEHATSMKVSQRLYEFLGKPKFCQHGNPIPDFDGKMETPVKKMLIEVVAGDVFKIERVLDNNQLLTYLNQRNIKLYDAFIIDEIDEFNQIIKLKDEQKTHVFSYHTARMIFGTIEPKKTPN